MEENKIINIPSNRLKGNTVCSMKKFSLFVDVRLLYEINLNTCTFLSCFFFNTKNHVLRYLNIHINS